VSVGGHRGDAAGGGDLSHGELRGVVHWLGFVDVVAAIVGGYGLSRRRDNPYPIVAWATKALDEVRRQTWNQLRSARDHRAATAFRGSRWALMKGAEDLTGRQKTTLAGIAKTNARLYRAYLCSGSNSGWCSPPPKANPGRFCWPDGSPGGRRCRIPEFVKLALRTW
jgi:hypothetical protein